MTLRERLLGAAVSASRPLLPALGLASSRLARAAAERRGVVSRLRAWAEAERGEDVPTVWLHGASAGELTGAAPALAELRRRRRVQVVVSYFSPSAEPVLGRLSPDFADVLPLDTPRETRRALAAVRPDVLVFAKDDVWPNLTRSAADRGVPLALVNGTVRPESSRLRPASRWLLRPAYGRLARAGAVSAEDAERLAALGVDREALRVTGDAAFDWALERARRAEEDPASPARTLERLRPSGRPVLVAGSTWREDEAALFAAAASLAADGRPVDLVVVPHDPDASALAAIEERCRETLGIAPERWSERRERASGADAPGEAAGPAAAERVRADGPAGAPPLVVDRVGLLAELYAAADVAFVGGGFGGTGLHSVVEPAAAGVPVLFGDRSTRREARALEAAGGGRAVTRRELARAIGTLLDHEGLRRRTGEAARRYVGGEAGAAAASADLVEEALDG